MSNNVSLRGAQRLRGTKQSNLTRQRRPRTLLSGIRLIPAYAGMTLRVGLLRSLRSLAMTLILAALVLTAAFAEDIAIYNFEGKASLRRDNTVYQLDYDMPCRPNDILRSDKNGYIDIAMTRFAGTRLLGATECRLIKIDSNNKHIKINYGTVMVNLKPLASDGSYEIETPIIIAKVAGAQFTSDPKNNLFLVEHLTSKGRAPYSVAITKAGNLSVFVKESYTTVTMLGGQIVEVPEGIFAPTARNAAEEELERLAKANSIYITED